MEQKDSANHGGGAAQFWATAGTIAVFWQVDPPYKNESSSAGFGRTPGLPYKAFPPILFQLYVHAVVIGHKEINANVHPNLQTHILSNRFYSGNNTRFRQSQVSAEIVSLHRVRIVTRNRSIVTLAAASRRLLTKWTLRIETSKLVKTIPVFIDLTVASAWCSTVLNGRDGTHLPIEHVKLVLRW